MNKRDRLKLLSQAADDPRLQGILIEKSKRDICFWFNTFCWTYDPRLTDPDLPFLLYPFQEETIKAIQDAIDGQYDIGIEKSRDMGVSWMIILIYQYYWLFFKGSNFLIGSRKASEVDLGYIDPAETILGKFRYNLSRLPKWMKPQGFDMKRHSKIHNIRNPENGNIVSGEASSHSFGRGARKRSIGLDEFAFWPFPDHSWGSCSQSTRCRIVWSTPYGQSNKYAELMNDSSNEEITLTLDTAS